jgi:hypothetical protein
VRSSLRRRGIGSHRLCSVVILPSSHLAERHDCCSIAVNSLSVHVQADAWPCMCGPAAPAASLHESPRAARAVPPMSHRQSKHRHHTWCTQLVATACTCTGCYADSHKSPKNSCTAIVAWPSTCCRAVLFGGTMTATALCRGETAVINVHLARGQHTDGGCGWVDGAADRSVVPCSILHSC